LSIGVFVHWCIFSVENNESTDSSVSIETFLYPQFVRICLFICELDIESEKVFSSPVADISIPYYSKLEALISMSNCLKVELAKTPTHAKVVAIVVISTTIRVSMLIYSFLPNIYFFRIDLYLLSKNQENRRRQPI
jgi:hypothetical protein